MLIVLVVRRDDGEFVSEIVITSFIIHITHWEFYPPPDTSSERSTEGLQNSEGVLQ